MNIIFFGSSQYSIIAAEALQKHFGLKAIVTLNDRLDSRKKKLVPNPVKAFGLQHEIPVITADTLHTEVVNQIAELHPDFLVVLDYGLFLPEKLLKLPTYAPLNIHPSLLPKYRGPSPAQTALLQGEKTTGVSIIEMVNEIDAGDIYAQKTYEIQPNDTNDSLLAKLDTLGAELIIQVINDFINGTVKKTAQDEKQVTFTEKYQKSDGYIDVQNPPSKEKVDLMIRAFYPWPSAWATVTINNREIRIKLLPEKQLQVEGKKPMTVKDFLNGYPQLKEFVEKIY